MFDDRASFLSRTYLKSMLDFEFREYLGKGTDAFVLAKLQQWNGRDKKQTETQAENAFVQVFFVELWGNGLSGAGHENNHTIAPKFTIQGGSNLGNKGAADLALGWFRGDAKAVPQVICEFKDIRSKLDAKQNRKGSNLSPIEQCLTYLRAARKNIWGSEPVQPWWGLVTDMNEFRLYWWNDVKDSYLRFTISGRNDLFETHDLLTESDDAQFDRFLFWKLLRRDSLISISGKPELWRIVERQGRREHEIEEEFYKHYKDFRERLFKTLILWNKDFPGSKTELLRISQRLLDRFIFAFYCEDMGERMLFPPQFIRDKLADESKSEYYEESGTNIWDWLKRLFHYMNAGGKFGQREVPKINGGLFEDNALINNLVIPNFVFAAPGQGANAASLDKDKETLLFLSGYYNYAAKGDATQSLTLYTLGRIFEQSITELEYKVGELEGRDTVAKLSKRKRDGVYYTPEWVVNYMVHETMEPWFKAARAGSGWNDDEPTAEALQAYLAKLRTIKVIDPACGSGAFLISAFRKLLQERMSVAAMMQERALKDDQGIGDDESKIVTDILKENLFGVDLNPASVEIAKLALWLHTARVRSPLSSLDGHLVCGNSLVASDIWTMVEKTPLAEGAINPFDWEGRFAEGSFDIVLGNPPYVKLQNLMKVDPDVVAYLKAQRQVGTYESTQTGNFDLYLPFIEKGLRLLREGGRMAYIAPSLWAVNEYGAGLRKLLHRTRQLERWLDFKSFQVFKEAITYTALQFYSLAANDSIAVASAPDGEIGDLVFDSIDNGIRVQELAASDGWNLYEVDERKIVVSLADRNHRLDNAEISKGITVGIQTSADHIYHFGRSGKNCYSVVDAEGESVAIEIEDAIVRPLVSGPEAKRFLEPATARYLLFPYQTVGAGSPQLIPESELKKNFPLAFKYLKKNEKELRARESSSFDDAQWYRFGRNQNLDKQELPKLIVAQTVPSMRVSADFAGKFYLNNVRVNGILPAKGMDIAFLLGVLNGDVVDYVFRRIGKPKQGGWFEANKQFIAPLPVPKATPKQQAVIGKMARKLQDMWTSRRDLIAEVEARLSVLPRQKFRENFLWPDLPDLRKALLPKSLKESERAKWMKEEHERLVAARLDALQGFLDIRAEMTSEFNRGELRLHSDGRPVLSKIFLEEDVGPLVAQYWRYVISKRLTDAKSFARELASYPSPDAQNAAPQFIARVNALLAKNADILADERDMNEALYNLYKLSTDERQLIEDDCARRPLL